MSTEAGQTPHHAHEELTHLKELAEKYGLPAAVGLGLALLVLIGFNWFGNRRASSQTEAMLMLSAAQSPEELQTVATRYASSPAAPLAKLQLCMGYYSTGDYDKASAEYEAFLNEYADHEFAPGAELGLAHTREAQGKREEALEDFRRFQRDHTGHFLLPQAQLGEGRCLEQLGRFTEAKQVYEEMLVSHPDSPWSAQLEATLDRVTALIANPELSQPAPAMDSDFPLVAPTPDIPTLPGTDADGETEASSPEESPAEADAADAEPAPVTEQTEPNTEEPETPSDAAVPETVNP